MIVGILWSKFQKLRTCSKTSECIETSIGIWKTKKTIRKFINSPLIYISFNFVGGIWPDRSTKRNLKNFYY
ncbi:hypothetical protein LEP1GSC043_0791 [Leptospira weilii str. Ecochallenge]|uniref:Uncharacterized protein n=2 Tax=Leptospira weilii TaxID=28184 RepID=N1UBR9_9LEPT|nr:hypothetical protein LEP1GSC038_4170 [Leptospira weilii str. 2006001855]EMY16572.1 hypothetical protein LEP1GSC043_0791 [Leptospira weilii str. Ecochallenge]QDK24425.1 hypothetical protein FHG67_18210 [Leptospira weilii]QDK28384.1 hypothetical protein FHG68_18265 [Leptospira weilii]